MKKKSSRVDDFCVLVWWYAVVCFLPSGHHHPPSTIHHHHHHHHHLLPSSSISWRTLQAAHPSSPTSLRPLSLADDTASTRSSAPAPPHLHEKPARGVRLGIVARRRSHFSELLRFHDNHGAPSASRVSRGCSPSPGPALSLLPLDCLLHRSACMSAGGPAGGPSIHPSCRRYRRRRLSVVVALLNHARGRAILLSSLSLSLFSFSLL